jgi:hypothetical protein
MVSTRGSASSKHNMRLICPIGKMKKSTFGAKPFTVENRKIKVER